MARPAVTTRDDVVTVALRLAGEHGPTGLHVARIARECGVSVGTIYNHFPSKDHLLAAVAAAVEQRYVEAMQRAAPAGRPLRPDVPGLVAALLDVATTPPTAPATAGLRDLGTPEGGSVIRSWIADRVAAAQDDGDVGTADPHLLARLAFALVAAAVSEPDLTGRHPDVPALLSAGLTGLLPRP